MFFCLFCLFQHQRGQQSAAGRDLPLRDRASQSLYRWDEDFEDIVHSITNNERLATPVASLYKPPTYPAHPRSPYLLRIRPLALANDDGPVTSFISHSSSDGSLGDPHGYVPTVETPSRATGKHEEKAKLDPGHEWWQYNRCILYTEILAQPQTSTRSRQSLSQLSFTSPTFHISLASDKCGIFPSTRAGSVDS
jgi:hypothetical protein